MADPEQQGLTNKVIASTVATGLATSITTLVVWVVNTADHVVIPDYVQGAITAILATIGTLLAGWLTRNSGR